MKFFTNILLFIAIVLIGFNVTMIDFNNPFDGDSSVALIGVLAAICAVIILFIFRMSKKIEDKLKG